MFFLTCYDYLRSVTMLNINFYFLEIIVEGIVFAAGQIPYWIKVYSYTNLRFFYMVLWIKFPISAEIFKAEGQTGYLVVRDRQKSNHGTFFPLWNLLLGWDNFCLWNKRWKINYYFQEPWEKCPISDTNWY